VAPVSRAPSPAGAQPTAWRRLAGGLPGKWEVWKYNWLAHHKVVRALERARRHAGGLLLDVGCGSMETERWFRGQVTDYLGVDLTASPYLGARRPTAFARAEALPFRGGSMDTVLGLSMLTYLPEPARMIAEAHRVLRPGGTLILEFTQMAWVHDEPHDYFRFTRYGAGWLLEREGFEVVEAIPIGGLWARVGLTTIAALNRLNRGPTRVLTEVPVRILYVALQLAFEGLDRLFFDPREVLAHLVVARRRLEARPRDPAPG
jgi:SAM-dependent methyltransferase